MVVPLPSTMSGFRLPDLWTNCPFPVVYRSNWEPIAAASERWVENGSRVFTDDMRRHLYGLRSGELAAYCYTQCNDERFRVACDFLNVLFLLDDLSDGMMTKDTEVFADIIMNAMAFPESYRPTHTKGKEQPGVEPDASYLIRDYWMRCMPDVGPNLQARLTENLDLYLAAVGQQAYHRDTNGIPKLEEYIALRRLSSGCKPLFDILEYSLELQLPDYVVQDPLLLKMKDCVNDFVGLSNDIFSYNVERSRSDTHNLVTVIMENYSLDLQSAVDRTGELCEAALDQYCKYKAELPLYGLEIDNQVAAYVQGLENWISGSLSWSFTTLRYFGSQGSEIKEHRWVKLLSQTHMHTHAT